MYTVSIDGLIGKGQCTVSSDIHSPVPILRCIMFFSKLPTVAIYELNTQYNANCT
jgi:hypothetical protein